MDYKEFSANDFALDHYFNEWVRFPTPEKNQFWELWLAEHPEKKEEIEIAREIIYTIYLPAPQLDSDQSRQLWENIQRRNREEEQVIDDTRVLPIIRKREWFGFQYVAASITLLIGLSALFWFYSSNKENKTVSYHTPFGEIKILTLPDSSKVFLNANSTLTFGSKWDKSADREVTLKGEAFFEVTRKHGRGNAKFRVHSGGLRVEVLGTQFNVYNRHEKVKVVLEEGSVQLSAPETNGKVRMKPGELVEYTASNTGLIPTQIDPSRYSGWIKHELAFDDAPLMEVARSIEDILNLKIKFEDNSYQVLPFTGTLSFANPDELLTVLSKSFNIKITRSENVILFHKK
ncbi:FecR family protein [Dyadobacter bucti]|uniref:FecR family protein n=1 Tax=Dyadobacter bucti TaxID=2572203 RepID=UPI00110937FB|nr:FecR domain-containing protein [Dyadobacter bucti]